MRLLLCVLAASAVLLEEPAPLTEEERSDEAAQSNRRTKWIACMYLARLLAVDHELELSPILNRSRHDKEATRKKIIADIIYKCVSTVTLYEAHDILADDKLDIMNDKYEPYLSVDESQFLDPERNISLTAEQVALYAEIEEEARNTHDGFDKETSPVVDSLEPPPEPLKAEEVDYQLVGVIVACNVGLLSFVLYCWKCRSSPVQDVRDKKRDRRKKK